MQGADLREIGANREPAIEQLRLLAHARAGGFQTANEFAADLLRRAIVHGVLNQGSPLRQDELAAALGISAIPVREALRQLQAEGLVDFAPRHGATVATLTGEEVIEISEMRAVLEPLALKLSLPHILDSQLEECERILDRMDQTPDGEPVYELHRKFHMGLYSAAGRKRLLNLIASYELRMERYFRFLVGQLSYHQRGQAEHRELLSLCRQRDVNQACALLERHILGGVERFAEFVAQ
jgi:DNA-binding GntR family transcriptional regulator